MSAINMYLVNSEMYVMHESEAQQAFPNVAPWVVYDATGQAAIRHKHVTCETDQVASVTDRIKHYYGLQVVAFPTKPHNAGHTTIEYTIDASREKFFLGTPEHPF